MSARKPGKQQRAYVLLPRRVKSLPVALPQSTQGTHSCDIATELRSPLQSTLARVRPEAYVSTLDDSVSTNANDTATSDSSALVFSDEDELSTENDPDMDYTEPGNNFYSKGILDEDQPVEFVGRKRRRDNNESDSDKSGKPTTRGNTRRCSKRSQRTVHTSEQDDSAEKIPGSLPGSSRPEPKGPAKPSTSKAVARKRAKRNPHKQTQSEHSATPSLLFSNDRLFIHPQGNTYKFTFQNLLCTHLLPSNPQGTLSPATIPHPIAPDSLSDFDSSCVALRALNMCFFRPLNMVFCRTHKVCVPLSSLKNHITAGTRQRHAGMMTGPFGTNLIEAFLHHVASAFHLSLTQTFYSQGSDIKQLSKPIPYMDKPCVYLQCPLCKLWLRQSGKGGWRSAALRQHLQHRRSGKCSPLLEIPEAERPVLKECYGQRPCGIRGLDHIPLIEIVGWNPEMARPSSTDSRLRVITSASPDKPATATPDPLSQEYVEACKWNIYFPTSAAETLHELCLLPNLFFSARDDQNQNIDEETLERGLYEVQNFLLAYLKDANSFIDTCEVGFRSTLTRG